MLPLTPSNTETSRHCAVVSLQKATSLTAGLLWRISALFSLLFATSVFMCPIHVCARVWKPENNLSWHSPGTFLLFRNHAYLWGACMTRCKCGGQRFSSSIHHVSLGESSLQAWQRVLDHFMGPVFCSLLRQDLTSQVS